MVESSKPLAAPAAAQGLAALFADDQTHRSYHAALHQLVEYAPVVTGAAGVAFYERCATGTRVVAIAGLFDWMRGLPAEVSGILPPWESGPLVTEFHWLDFPSGAHLFGLAGGRLCGVLRAAVVADGRNVGCFALGYTDDPPQPGTSRHAAVGLLAACAAGMFTGRRGSGSSSDLMALPTTPVDDQDHNLFIAVTSHALRTPATVIRGYADTLADRWDRLDDGARRTAVSTIRQRARDLGRLLDRLLAAAGDRGSQTIRPSGAPFDLLAAVHVAVEDLPSDLRTGVRLRLPPSLPRAFGDRTAMGTIVTELVTNAVKNSPERPDIEVSAGAEGRTVWLSVADRGVGIRPEDVERAFERFWQSDRDGRRRRGGVGLGLYLVRQVVERHRGWVSLRPRRGGGTVAEVRLPAADTMEGEV